MKIAFSSVSGRRHLVYGGPCEDCSGGFSGSIAAVAAADGLGARANAEISAACAVEAVLAWVREHGLAFGDSELFDDLNRRQRALGLPLDSLGTTLLFAASDGSRFVAGHIGDGVILHRSGNTFRLLSAPVNGEFSYETRFLPEAVPADLRVYRGEVQAEDCLLLATDGISDVLCDAAGVCGPECREIESCVRLLPQEAAGAWLADTLGVRFGEYGTDDKTVAVLAIERERG